MPQNILVYFFTQQAAGNMTLRDLTNQDPRKTLNRASSDGNILKEQFDQQQREALQCYSIDRPSTHPTTMTRADSDPLFYYIQSIHRVKVKEEKTPVHGRIFRLVKKIPKSFQKDNPHN